MAFEQWFEQRFPANTPEGRSARTGQVKDYLEEAWEAGYDQGVADSDPAVHVEEGLPGMGEYTYEEFSRDCDRW